MKDLELLFKSLKTKMFFCTHFFIKKSPSARLSLDMCETNRKPRIFIGSWNVGHSRCPPSSTIEEWIHCSDEYDLIALGVQECKKTRKTDWLSTIQDHAERKGYVLISYVPMWEMFLLVFVRREI
jgi:hypothetical protein